ncbi:MAG: low molecular weight protein-tyrosine-phosphatase [Bacteroidota bacterium]
MKILFVCLGNICRSPLAAGILRKQVMELGLGWQVDSAGLANKFVGCTADPRVVEVAQKHRIDLLDHKVRKFQNSDFVVYDVILTMSDDLARRLVAKAANVAQADKIWLLPDFLDGLADTIDLPDPYFWEVPLFESLFYKIEAACVRVVETFNTPDIMELFEETVSSNALTYELRT